MSLREEISGKKKQTNSFQSIRKLQHLQNLAVWAAGEASIPSLAAIYGRRFAVTGEAMGLSPDPSMFSCKRCKTILQPGSNCTVRSVKIRAKTKNNQKKVFSDQQNNVIYNCHFCSHQNVKRVKSKGHCPPNQKHLSEPILAHNNQAAVNKPETEKAVEIALPLTIGNKPETEKAVETALPLTTVNKLEIQKTVEIALPSTSTKETSSVTGNLSAPSVVKCRTLLDSKKRTRNKPKTKKNDELEAKSAMVEVSSLKRKRKGWTSLREIAENNEKERAKTFNNLSIPFTL